MNDHIAVKTFIVVASVLPHGPASTPLQFRRDKTMTATHMDQIAKTQALLWVDAEIRRLDLADKAAIAERIAAARRGLGLLAASTHDVSRATWMYREIIGRLNGRMMQFATA